MKFVSDVYIYTCREREREREDTHIYIASTPAEEAGRGGLVFFTPYTHTHASMYTRLCQSRGVAGCGGLGDLARQFHKSVPWYIYYSNHIKPL